MLFMETKITPSLSGINMERSSQQVKRKDTCKFLLSMILLAWVLEIIDQVVLSSSLDQLGIRPRSVVGLVGIPLIPFLHGGFVHLISNTLPFLVLGYVFIRAEKRKFIMSSLLIIFLSGLGVWLFGRSNSLHVGASGLVYGYFGYIISRGFYEKKFKWFVLGMVVFFFYGGMIFGMIPFFTDVGVSWEGHLFGFLAGAYVGRGTAKSSRAK